MDVAGAVALVTGGASGLGPATTERLAEAGAKLVIADLPGSAGAQIEQKFDGNVRFVATDVTDETGHADNR